jgi:hypothetical protein
MYRALDAYLGQPARDWSAEHTKVRARGRERAREAEAKRVAQRATGTKPSLSTEKYAGVYADSMYGDLRVRRDGERLVASYGTMFEGALEHWHYDTFRATWNARNLGRTFLTFALDSDGNVRGVEFEGLGSFNRRPDTDSTRTTLSGAPRR